MLSLSRQYVLQGGTVSAWTPHEQPAQSKPFLLYINAIQDVALIVPVNDQKALTPNQASDCLDACRLWQALHWTV